MKRMKKWIMGTLALGFVTTLSAGVCTYTASAQPLSFTDVTLQNTTITINNQEADAVTLTVGETNHVIRMDTQDGAALRVSTPNGLRFYSYISQKDLETLGDTYGVEDVDFGTVLIRKDDFVDPTTTPLELGATGVQSKSAKANFVKVGADSLTDTDRDGIFRFNATITGIPEEGYSVEFMSRAYISVTDGGQTYTAYTDYEMDANTRSIKTVAQKMLNAGATLTNVERVTAEEYTAIDQTDKTVTLDKTDNLKLALAEQLGFGTVTAVYDYTAMNETEVKTATSATVAANYLATMDETLATTENARTRTLSVYADGNVYHVNALLTTKVITTADELINWTDYTTVVGEKTANGNYQSWKYTGYVVLGDNINLGTNTVYGPENFLARDKTMGFQGVFDGRGYTISGGTYLAGGLFGTLSENATLKNTAFVNAALPTYGWENARNSQPFGAIVADYTSGKIENCLFDVVSYSATGDKAGYHATIFGNKADRLFLYNSVIYSSKSQWSKGSTPAAGYQHLATSGGLAVCSNVYIFANSVSSYDTTKTDADVQTVLLFGDSGEGNMVKGYQTWCNLTAYILHRQLTDSITVNESTMTVAQEMATKLTASQWDLTGNKVAFKSKSSATALAPAKLLADYELYSGLDTNNTPVANTAALTINAPLADGEVALMKDGVSVGAGTVANGVISIPANVIKDLGAGEHSLYITDSNNALTYIKLTVWTALINDADELANWQAYTTKTNVVAAANNTHDSNKAHGYWTYDGWFALAADIDMTGKTITTDLMSYDDSTGFQGVFDGRGYTISNATYGEGGLFGTLGKNGVLRNVAFVGGTLATTKWAANNEQGIFARAITANFTAGKVENCIFDVIITGESTVNNECGFGAYLFGTKATAHFKNVVIYTYRWQNASKKWIHMNAIFTHVAFGGQFENSYVFSRKSSSLSETVTDSDVTFAIANSDNSSVQLNALSGVTIYEYHKKLSDTIGETTTTVAAEMATKLTGEYWNFDGDKVTLDPVTAE
ncbi:MAG: hypothetical protein J6A63_01530 [Clostridia bacterium]|nr:hypothetical protein [Clostridia bacterium]